MLTFPDGSKVGIVGLNDVMDDLYHEGQPANLDAASRLIERLEARNYFPSSEINIYKMLLLSEYKLFLEDKSKIIEPGQPPTEESKK